VIVPCTETDDGRNQQKIATSQCQYTDIRRVFLNSRRSVMFVSTGSRPFRSHHLAVSRCFLLVETRPWLVAMLRRQRLLRLAPHTMLRIVFVAVY